MDQPPQTFTTLKGHSYLSLPPFHSFGMCLEFKAHSAFITAPTFVLLLQLLVARTLPQIGKNLSQFADDNVICGQRGLCLKENANERSDFLAKEPLYEVLL